MRNEKTSWVGSGRGGCGAKEMKIKKICAGEYEIGRRPHEFSISRKEGTRTDWTVSGQLRSGEYFRETVESFEEAKEVARIVHGEERSRR